MVVVFAGVKHIGTIKIIVERRCNERSAPSASEPSACLINCVTRICQSSVAVAFIESSGRTDGNSDFGKDFLAVDGYQAITIHSDATRKKEHDE